MPAKLEREGRAANWRGATPPTSLAPAPRLLRPSLGGLHRPGATARIALGGWTAASPSADLAALHIRISEPKALPELVTALHERVRYVVQQIAVDAVAVSVLGSFADGGEEDLKLFLAEWRSSRGGVHVEVVLDDVRAATVLPTPLG